MDLIVMCGNQPRHLYFALKLVESFPNSAIIIEEAWERKKMSPLMEKYFANFKVCENTFFQDYVTERKKLLKKKVIARVEQGKINDPILLKRFNPKFIAVYGTSIISNEIIKMFPNRILNLHAGLSPYYRGSGTNVWPILNDELDKVGMTVHYLSEGIDDGKVISQDKPVFNIGDTVHIIGCKCNISGTNLMIDTIENFLGNRLVPGWAIDKSLGKLYLKKDFTDEHVKKLSNWRYGE